MQSITEREFKPTYELGIQVYKENMSFKDAIARLVDGYQMNERSAKYSIHFLQHMLNAKKYTRMTNNPHIEYYANRILEDFGVEKLKVFLKGLELHIKYRKSIGPNVPGLCAVHTKYSEKAGVPPIFN